MDRVIKFRGKRIDNGEWVYGYYVKDGANRALIAVPGGGSPTVTLYPVDPETVGQFTGLTDKNGKEIYEGDFCKCNNGVRHYIAKVVIDIANPSFVLKYWNKYGYEDVEYDFVQCEYMVLEVIGTVYDNPELLKETEESH